MTTINLEGLSLTNVSDYTFPSHTTSIELDDNSLQDLSDLPINLQGIRVNNNNLGLTGYFGFTGITGPTGVTGVAGPSGTTGYMGMVDLASFYQLNVFEGIKCNISYLYNIPSTVTKMNLMHNNIVDISCFSSCTNLAELILDNNKISDISTLPTTLRNLSINNNLLTALPNMSSYTEMEFLQIKNNPITTIGTLPRFIRDLDITGTQLTDFSSICHAGIRLLNIKYSGKDLSSLDNTVSKFNVGGDIKEKNTLSYINIFYTSPLLYNTTPTFMTIDTVADEWTKISLSNFAAKCSNNFIIKDDRVYYYGKKYILFNVTAGMVLKGILTAQMVLNNTNDLVRIVGIKNKKNDTVINYSNSILTANDLSTTARSIPLNFLFMLNTGDYFEIYIKTGINNTLTLYSFNLIIKEITK